MAIEPTLCTCYPKTCYNCHTNYAILTTKVLSLFLDFLSIKMYVQFYTFMLSNFSGTLKYAFSLFWILVNFLHVFVLITIFMNRPVKIYYTYLMLMGFFENFNSHWTYKHWERVKIRTFA